MTALKTIMIAETEVQVALHQINELITNLWEARVVFPDGKDIRTTGKTEREAWATLEDQFRRERATERQLNEVSRVSAAKKAFEPLLWAFFLKHHSSYLATLAHSKNNCSDEHPINSSKHQGAVRCWRCELLSFKGILPSNLMVQLNVGYAADRAMNKEPVEVPADG